MKKQTLILAAILCAVLSFSQSTLNTYTFTRYFVNSDAQQIYEGARIAVPSMTLPNSLNTYTYTTPFKVSDNQQIYNAMRGIGDAVTTITANSWNLTGNSVSTNTAYIGTKTNRSLTLKTAGHTIIKADSASSVLFYKRPKFADVSYNQVWSDSLIKGAIFTYSASAYRGLWFGTTTRDPLLLGSNFDGGSVPAFAISSQTSGAVNAVIAVGGSTSYTSNSSFRACQGGGARVIDAVTAAGSDLFRIEGTTGNLYNRGLAVIGSTVANTNATLNVAGTMSVSSTSTLTGLQNNGTINSTGAATLTGARISGTLNATGAATVVGALSTSSIVSTSKTAGIGYAVGSGSTVTQATSRTTGVTISDVVGSITLFSTAGSTTYQDFTVTNSTVGVNDVIIINQRSGTDRYVIEITAVAAGSFRVTFATTGGTTVESPVFNFAVIKGATN